MKNTIILITLYFVSTKVISQNISFGPKIGFGASSLKSKNLESYFTSVKSADHCIKKYSVEESMGFAYNVGGFVEYLVKPKIALGAELCFQSISSSMKIQHIHDQATRAITKSENKFRLNTINLPLIGKYYFKEGKGPFVLTGVAFDFLVNAQIKTKEVTTYETYNNSGSYVSTIAMPERNTTVKLDGANKFRASVLLGVGMLFPIKDKGIFVDARYSLPITKSELYTSNTSYNSTLHTSNPFSSSENNNAKNKGYNLNDFKSGVILINIGYRF